MKIVNTSDGRVRLRLPVFLRISAFAGLLLVLSGQTARAQQPFTYTQYMDNLSPINATYSLLDKAGAVHALVRKQ
ncbi:MAG TPA: hypothetical protein VD772_10930, partial [Anseongella sp.]|nr:hypothetical protein [Anseongella sp.]